MDFRLGIAIVSAKALKSVINLFKGGGTAAPGLLAEYIDQNAFKKLSVYYAQPILITGTNGKTTTSRLLGEILKEKKIPFIHNRAGSNLLRGLIATLIDGLKIGFYEKKTPLLEVDEFILPAVIKQTDPKIIIFNNLFRDQLDRYGEVDTIRKNWQKALSQLSAESVLVLNADDPSIAHLADQTSAKVVYFGIEDKVISENMLPHASDFTSCINCGSDLVFDGVYLSHLGRYKCTKCSLKRPKPDIYAKHVFLNNENGFLAKISTPKGGVEIKTSLPGLHNLYNCLAAISAGLVLGINLPVIKKALESSKTAFGRMEKLEANKRKLTIALVKNPAGFNELLRTIFRRNEKKYLFIIINDLIADGRDVSWLWDVDFETIAGKVQKIWVSGIRARDMNLRLKYAGLEAETTVNEDIELILDDAISAIPSGETLYILPTYTAMLSLKKILSDKGIGKNFWEE